MDKDSITIGHHYAIRERAAEDPQRVRVLEAVRSGRWRVEWIDPNPGLVDFVQSRHIICPWKEVRALLQDERNAERLADVVENSGYPGPQHPLTTAVQTVLDATGERTVFLHHGALNYDQDALDRIVARTGAEAPEHPAGYTDRNDRRYLPWTSALELATAFARAEPSTVLDPIDAQEREWIAEAQLPDERWVADLLVEYRAAWAIVRQWAGLDAAIAAREERIRDLERLLTRVMWDLRHPSVDPTLIANRIGRALRRH